MDATRNRRRLRLAVELSNYITSMTSMTTALHRNQLCFWCILSTALILRIAAAVAIDRHVQAEGRQFLIEGDAYGYWELGQKIAAGEEYTIFEPPRRVHRTPGFPLLLAASIRIFGNSIFAATIVMAFVGCGCCWLTWLLARRITDGSTALWSMLLVAVSPLQLGSNVQILSETWFTFWLLLCLIALVPLVRERQGASRRCQGEELQKTPRASALSLTELTEFRENVSPSFGWLLALVCGLLTGLTVLVRPGWILWCGFSSLILLTFGQQPIARRVVFSGLIVAGCFLALLPWAWRNHTVTGHWIFTSLWSGPSLYDGLHPEATGASDMKFFDAENVLSTMSEFDANAHYKQRAIEFVIANPVRAIELAILKAGRYLSPTLNAAGFSGGPFSLFCLIWYTVFVGLIVMGTIDLRKQPAILLLLAGPFLQFLLVHMVFVGSIRYRLPVEFPLSIIAAKGLAAVLNRVGWVHLARPDS